MSILNSTPSKILALIIFKGFFFFFLSTSNEIRENASLKYPVLTVVRNLPITLLKFILFALFFWYSNTKPFKTYCSICIIQFKVKCSSDQSLWTNFWTCFMYPTKIFEIIIIIITVTVIIAVTSRTLLQRKLALAAS